MHLNYLLLPTMVSAAAVGLTQAASTNAIDARDTLDARQEEYRWCYGHKINSGSFRKYEWRIRGVDTDYWCNGPQDSTATNAHPWATVKACLSTYACAPSSGGYNCGDDAQGFFHGGINVGLGCSGDDVKHCIDRSVGILGNTDYVCNSD